MSDTSTRWLSSSTVSRSNWNLRRSSALHQSFVSLKANRFVAVSSCSTFFFFCKSGGSQKEMSFLAVGRGEGACDNFFLYIWITVI